MCVGGDSIPCEFRKGLQYGGMQWMKLDSYPPQLCKDICAKVLNCIFAVADVTQSLPYECDKERESE